MHIIHIYIYISIDAIIHSKEHACTHTYIQYGHTYGQTGRLTDIPIRMLAWLSLLGGSWDLVSKVISTLIGVKSSYKYSYLIYTPTY